MSLLTVDIPDDLIQSIKKISSNLNKSSSEMIQEVIIEIISEYQDAEIALERLNNPDMETLTLEETEKELGI